MKSKRSLKLIADFVDGYASGWAMAVGEEYRLELDIRMTPRMEEVNGIQIQVLRWTQGRLYNFREGHVIYDTPKGYLVWREALKHIRCRCLVVRSTPSNLSEDKESVIPGEVLFTLSKPNADCTTLVEEGLYRLNQNDFVEFLRYGTFDRDKALA